MKQNPVSMALGLQSNCVEGTAVSRLVKIYGAILFGLVLGAGVGVRAATITTGKSKHRSAGTARVAARLSARSGGTHTSVKRAATSTTGLNTHTTAKTMVAAGHGHAAHATLAVRRTRRRYYEHFSASSFADNLTLGDIVEGEDPVVRAAAIEALGNMNGTAIAIDPSYGTHSRHGESEAGVVARSGAMLDDQADRGAGCAGGRDCAAGYSGEPWWKVSHDDDRSAGSLEQSLF